MIKKEVVSILKSIGVDVKENEIETPENPSYGDASLPCFKLSKKFNKPPSQVAIEIARRIPVTKHPLLIKVEAVGGYVNFFFYWEKLAERVLRPLIEEKQPHFGKGKKVMVEYSQPNPVHSMHIGHARGTFIGDALARLFEYTGHKVVKANLMNDMGFQVAKLVTAYLLWCKNKRPKGKPDYWLWQLYVRFHQEMKNNPELEEMAREVLRKYEIESDKNITRVWKKLVNWCVRGFKETYKHLGIKFDIWFYESEFREKGKELVYEALARNIAFKSPEGVIIADLEKHGLPNTVLLRSDGTGLYITSDLGLTVEKFEKFKLDKSVWVVSSQQETYFKQLFKILELLGYKWWKNCYHCSFQHVNLPEGKMSSREGKAVLLDEVIKKLIEKAYEEVEKRNPHLSKRKKLSIAKKIGIGALKYAILKISPNESIIFDWGKMLEFEGNTCPYIQYAHTRCLGILKRAKKFKYEFRPLKLEEEEKKLLKVLADFHSVIIKAVKEMKPYYLANYLYALSVTFNEFYNSLPVLASKGEIKRFRLTLVKAVEITLRKGLYLLGIETPKVM